MLLLNIKVGLKKLRVYSSASFIPFLLPLHPNLSSKSSLPISTMATLSSRACLTPTLPLSSLFKKQPLSPYMGKKHYVTCHQFHSIKCKLLPTNYRGLPNSAPSYFSDLVLHCSLPSQNPSVPFPKDPQWAHLQGHSPVSPSWWSTSAMMPTRN